MLRRSKGIVGNSKRGTFLFDICARCVISGEEIFDIPIALWLLTESIASQLIKGKGIANVDVETKLKIV